MTTRRHRLIVGLTGGIGSGKSTVARMLGDLGASVIDADAVAKATTEPGGAAIDPIRSAFGDAFILPSGAMDRDAMRSHIFQCPEARIQLEAIIHPLVRCGIDSALAAAPVGAVVLDVPLLVEHADTWRKQVDVVVVVDCQEETQVQRVALRSGWPEATIRKVMGTQASRAQRLAAADAVVHNDGVSLADLKNQVHVLARSLGI